MHTSDQLPPVCVAGPWLSLSSLLVAAAASRCQNTKSIIIKDASTSSSCYCSLGARYFRPTAKCFVCRQGGALPACHLGASPPSTRRVLLITSTGFYVRHYFIHCRRPRQCSLLNWTELVFCRLNSGRLAFACAFLRRTLVETRAGPTCDTFQTDLDQRCPKPKSRRRPPQHRPSRPLFCISTTLCVGF
jgi:hypothetical protein